MPRRLVGTLAAGGVKVKNGLLSVGSSSDGAKEKTLFFLSLAGKGPLPDRKGVVTRERLAVEDSPLAAVLPCPVPRLTL